MKHHIENKIYHIEILPPKQDTDDLQKGLRIFANRYRRAMEKGYFVCITDNAMGLLSFQGTEVIEELGLDIYPDQLMIHINTFHTIENLREILDYCKAKKIKYLLIISGDGSERLPKLQPKDVGETDAKAVTSVELLRYINREYPDTFILGVAFNPYEPPEHEFEKMERKLAAGASFIITQPIIEKNDILDELLKRYPHIPVIVEAWMSKKMHLLSEAVGYEIPEDTFFDPIKTLGDLCSLYPGCGFYLSLLGFKTQFHLIPDIWK